jgi:hypothetical protein
MGNDGSVEPASEGLGPAAWASTYGIGGGGFLFQGDVSHTDYVINRSFSGISSNVRGTVGTWIKFLPYGNESALFSISNGFGEPRTELMLGLVRSGSTAKLTASVSLDGAVQWRIETAAGTVTANRWTYVVLRHNRDPRLFIDGVEVPFTYVVNRDRRKWISSLFSAVSPADRMILGGIPRDYSPFVALGFVGYMDEIRLWDIPLSEARILEDYLAHEPSSSSLSSASSSSRSSSSSSSSSPSSP